MLDRAVRLSSDQLAAISVISVGRLQDSSSAGAGSVKSWLSGSVSSKKRSRSELPSALNLQRSLDMVQKLYSGIGAAIDQQLDFQFISASMNDLQQQQQQQQLMSVLSEAMRQQIAYKDVIAKLQAELTEQHQYACEQAVLTGKMQDKVVAQRAGLKRIRKQCFRQARQLAKDEGFRAAVKVDNFAVPLPGSQAKFILSTTSIAEDNMAQAARMGRAVGTIELEGSGEPSEASPCAAGQEMSRIDGDEEPESVKPRNGFKCQYSNVASNKVWVEMPGPVRKRLRVGGTSISETVITSRLLTFFDTNISIRTLSKGMPQELENTALEVRAEFDHRKGCESRRLMDTGKPINLTGRMCRQTLTESLHASYLCLDRYIRQREWVKNCDVLTINLDGSSFNEHDMSGIVLHFTFIEESGTDALGTIRLKATTRSVCQSCLPIGDKISVDVRREDGSLFGKEVPERLVTSLAMSGNLYDTVNHQCCILGMDKGAETRGGGTGVRGAMRRNAFFGRGGPLEQIFGTREAIASVMNGVHRPFLQNCMDFLEVPPSEQFLAGFSKRPLPEQLDVDPTMPVPSLAFQITILYRTWDSEKKEHFVLKTIIEQCGSRPSTKLNPMAHHPCIRGGSASGKWCDKHALNRAGTAYTNYFKMRRSMKLSQKISSEMRKIQNHVALKNNIARILGTKGARRPKPSHVAIRNALGEKVVGEYREKYPRGMPRPEKGVGTRWNSVQEAVLKQDDSRLLVAATFPIALAHGKEEAKTRAGERVCSQHGFGQDDMTISFSPNLGRCFYHLNSPGYILHVAVSALIHVFSFKVLLAACADRGEHAALAMGGVNSIVATVDWVLRRDLFVVPSNKGPQLLQKFKCWSGKGASQGKWLLTHRLCHRGVPSIESNGRTFLSNRLERIPEGSKSKEPPALLHLYGRFYNPGMAGAISRTRDTMMAVCRMGGDGSVIPREYLSDYEGQQGSYAEKMEAAQWFLRQECIRAADCIQRKMLTTDPLGFLAGLSDVVTIHVRRTRDEFSFEVDWDNDFEEVDIASDKAISCANILLLQLKELLSLHGPTLCEFVQEPLRSMLKDDQMAALAMFAQRTERDLAGMTVVSGFERMEGYPKPVTSFPTLAKNAMKAATCITNNNPVESKWSLLTGSHNANVRNVSAEYMSAVFRKKDFHGTGLLGMLRLQDFQDTLARARDFRNKNKEGYSSVFRTNVEESQAKQNIHQKPRQQYQFSNIAETKRKKKDLHAESAERSREKKPRKRGSGAIANRYHSGSEGSESAESDESSEDSNGEDASSGANDSDEDSYHGEEAGGFDQDSPDLNAEGSSPSSDHASNESEVAGHGEHSKDFNDSAHLNHNEEHDSRRVFYESEKCEILRDMCKTREIRVIPSKGMRCRKEDYIIALMADDASCRALPLQLPSVAVNSDADSVMACPPHFPEPGNIEAFEPSELSQVVDSEAPVIQPSQDHDDSAGEDRSDVGSEFGSENGWGSDDDVPFLTRRNALGKSKVISESDPSGSGILIHISHPFPIVKDVVISDQQASDRPWKLDSIRHVLEKNKWKDTKVEYQLKGKKLVNNSVMLTRLDGKRFPLIKSAHLLYVVYTDDGLELAHLESVTLEIAHKNRGKAAEKVRIKYSRVLRTEKAIEECNSDNDHHSTTRSGICRVSSLGANSLRKLLAQQNQQGNTRLVFHRGDFPFETSAENIVGFVACQSACDGVDGASSNDEPKAFLARINASLRLDSSPTALKLGSLSEIDTVYLGPDFSEPAGEQD